MGLQIRGTGSYVPDAVVTNDHLHNRFGFDSDWIVKHTGILERRHALATRPPATCATKPPGRCIDKAGVRPGRHRPARGGHLHAGHVVSLRRLPGARSAEAQLRRRGHAGGLRRLHVRPDHRGGLCRFRSQRGCLIIGGDCNSRILNPDDIKTYPLFGDGAGAVLLTRGRPDQGLLNYSLGADGGGGDLLSRPACGSRMPPTPSCSPRACTTCTWMAGPSSAGRWPFCATPSRTCSRPAGLEPQDVDLYIPHQANIRIINAAIDVLRIRRSRVYNNLDRYGNTSAGSVPLALDEACSEGRVQPGNRIVLSGFGAGLAWGTLLIRW